MSPHHPGAASGEQRRWHLYKESPEDETVQQELVNVLSACSGSGSVPKPELEIRVAEFKRQVGLAEAGDLASREWSPVQRDPLLWEFRLRWDDQDILVRAYFHEPRQRLDQTVVLVFHVKDVSLPTQQEITAAQNAFINKATLRQIKGRENFWGLDWSAPILGA